MIVLQMVSERIPVEGGDSRDAEEPLLAEFQQDLKINEAVGVTAFAIPDADALRRAQEAIELRCGGVGVPGAVRIGPQVAQRFGAEQGARRYQRFQAVLVERQLVLAPGIGWEARAEPEGETLNDVGKRFGAFVLDTEAARPTAA